MGCQECKDGRGTGASPATIKGCPLCGESMRLSEREVQEKNGTLRQVREWICPECDYFEEADPEG